MDNLTDKWYEKKYNSYAIGERYVEKKMIRKSISR